MKKKVQSKPVVQSQMTNAQQQQFANSQQPQPILSNSIPQQIPQMQYPVQQQMQYPIQVSMPQPGVVVPNARVGYYGSRANNTPQVYQ
jgi:hypothetical protein